MADNALWRTINAHRAALAAQDTATTRDVVAAYADARDRLQPRLEALSAKIAQAAEEGNPYGAATIQQEQRYKDLIAALDTEIARLTGTTAASIATGKERAALIGTEGSKGQVEAVLNARGASPKMIGQVMAGWSNLNTNAMQTLIGASKPGSPLYDILTTNGKQTTTRARDVLLDGVITGQHPTVIARGLNGVIAGGLGRSLTVARTETHRVYREAARLTYAANQDVVAGWKWLSARNPVTCAVCWAMDGQQFDSDAPMIPHINCRCTMVPVVRSLPGLDPVPDFGTGVDAFDRLPDSTQIAILGNEKYEAYSKGEIALTDLVGMAHNDRWGDNRYERSLAAARKAARK